MKIGRGVIGLEIEMHFPSVFATILPVHDLNFPVPLPPPVVLTLHSRLVTRVLYRDLAASLIRESGPGRLQGQ